MDDDALMRRALRRFVLRAGFQPTLVASRADVRLVTEPHLGRIFDLDLHDGDGIDVAINLMKAGLVGHVIFLSGTTSEFAQRNASRVDLFMSKLAHEHPARLLNELNRWHDREAGIASGGTSLPRF